MWFLNFQKNNVEIFLKSAADWLDTTRDKQIAEGTHNFIWLEIILT